MNQIELNIRFSQIINILFHTDFTNLTKAASHKARSCRLCRVFAHRMASTSAASVLCEIAFGPFGRRTPFREICVRIKYLFPRDGLINSHAYEYIISSRTDYLVFTRIPRETKSPCEKNLRARINHRLRRLLGLHGYSLHPISLNLTSVSRFLLAVFICRCASAARSMRISSANEAHRQRERSASANNSSVQKRKKGCAEMMNRTAYAGFVTHMAWRTLADVDYCP